MNTLKVHEKIGDYNEYAYLNSLSEVIIIKYSNKK